MDKSTSLLSSSHLLQQVFKLHSSPFFHVVHPSIESVFLIFCSRCSALHGFFHQTIFFFSYHVSKVPQFSSFNHVVQSSFHSRRLQNTHSFVFFCVHDTLGILRMHFISKTLILCSPRFLMVQLSHQ